MTITDPTTLSFKWKVLFCVVFVFFFLNVWQHVDLKQQKQSPAKTKHYTVPRSPLRRGREGEWTTHGRCWSFNALQEGTRMLQWHIAPWGTEQDNFHAPRLSSLRNRAHLWVEAVNLKRWRGASAFHRNQPWCSHSAYMTLCSLVCRRVVKILVWENLSGIVPCAGSLLGCGFHPCVCMFVWASSKVIQAV